MLIILTGSIGAGKSTVCLKLVEWARRTGLACGGVLSHKMEGGGIIVEDVQTGEQMDLAGPSSSYSGPAIGDYSFSPEGIAFGIPAIEKAMGLPLAIIDELGPLELSGRGFSNAVPLLREPREGAQLVVIREELLNSFIPLFNRETMVLRTTTGRRDILPWQISRVVRGKLVICRPGM